MPNPQLLYNTEVFPFAGAFPEFASDLADRFNPATHPIAVCFSGGGPRSFACSLGQMRALLSIPALYDKIGMISCVSGGSWFGAPFTFADASISDADLLGPIVQPGAITMQSIRSISPTCLGSVLVGMSNSAINASVVSSIIHGVPANRIYARMLNALVLNPFGISDIDHFMSLDAATANEIVAKNTGLPASRFFLMRNNRPYFHAGATQISPIGAGMVMRHFEYSPIYSGTPQFFNSVGPAALPFGGGWVQSFGFDTSDPQAPGAGGWALVDAALHPFTISDVIGSSGAAPGSVLDKIGLPNLFSEFHYWPPRSAGQPNVTQQYSIVDGGDLENTGIVAPLWRKYPVIVACVNSSIALDENGTTNHDLYQGIDRQIAMLFGIETEVTTATREIREGAAAFPMMQKVAMQIESKDELSISIPQQNIQVFPEADFAGVRDGLLSAVRGGGPVYTISRHTVVAGNPFGIPSYDVTVVWLFNQRVADWVNALPADVANFLDSTDETNYMANFPNYHTVFQNKNRWLGIPELLWLSPQQVNLAADMWSWVVQQVAPQIQALV